MADSPITAEFDLVDHNGRPTTMATFGGRYTIVFFGFTHCKVVCPRALERLSAALGRLGPLADLVDAVYITVDPERDTPEVMKAFLGGYDARFVGLTGTRAQVDAAKASYRIFAERVADPDSPGSYDVPHTAISYLIGPDGHYIAHFTDAVSAPELAQRLHTLLERET